MEERDFFKSLYTDFFKIEEENNKISEELKQLDKLQQGILKTSNDKKDTEALGEEKNKENVSIEVKNVDADTKMKELFAKIENLYITDDSKDLLKKIIEYIRKYKEGLEKEYISFNMEIISSNKEVTNAVCDILYDATTYFEYIKRGKKVNCSLVEINSYEDIVKQYETSNAVVFKDFKTFSENDKTEIKKILVKLNEIVSENENNVLTILVGESQEVLNIVIDEAPELKEKFDDFKIIEKIPDVQDAYQEMLGKLEGNVDLDDDFKVKLLDYISSTYPKNELPYPMYRDNLYQKIIFNKEIPKYQKDKTLDEIFAELNELVGLESVKKVLKDLVNLMELKSKSSDDLKISNVNLHMVFLGNPGTGKTTVARIVAGILYNLKYIRQNKLIEVSSKDLVGEYVGQTAPKTMSVVERARGGVLFVDEAYSLASGGPGQNSSYNEEAIATLIQAMENYRDDLVVIFAGYTKEMQDFLNANSGIVSRIGYTLEFEDYTIDELTAIFNQMMKKSGFIVSKEAEDRLKEIINEYIGTQNFGNARFVRNVYEKSLIKHASNTIGKKSKKILKTITAEDISSENLLKM